MARILQTTTLWLSRHTMGWLGTGRCSRPAARRPSPEATVSCRIVNLNGISDSQLGFADAITNNSSPSDSYPYYLPLGVELPGGARPTCNDCLEETMGIYANAASNASQPISQTFQDAAEQVNMGCGPNFINSTVEITSFAPYSSSPNMGPVVMALAFIFAFLM